MKIKSLLKKIPFLGEGAVIFKAFIDRRTFKGSDNYWERRYKKGGSSGAGSYGRLAEFKAEALNAFVEKHQIQTIIEFGCGDGDQLSLAKYPKYTGLDVSKTAIEMCREKFKFDDSKSFFLYHPSAFVDNQSLFQADLAISLDVIYHLIEDDIYIKYIRDLFNSAKKFVIIYSSNHEEDCPEVHMRHRNFTRLVKSQLSAWFLAEKISNPYPNKLFDDQTSPADLYVFKNI